MFDLKKNNQDSSGPIGPKENQDPVFIRTMQNDLDAASGIAASQPQQEDNTFYEKPELKEETVSGGGQPSYPRNEMGGKNSRSYSPFLNTAGIKTSPPPPPLPPSPPSFKNKPDASEQPKHIPKWSRIILWSSFFIACATLMAGGYYFWTTRITTPSPMPDVQPDIIPEPIVIEKEPEKFSADNPNYLSIDTEKDTVETTRQLILNTALEIKELKIDVPIEFIVVDKNNNPISLPIFAILNGLKFSPVLDNLEDDFSLFIYSGAGNPRVGLAVNFKDKTKTASAMSAKEKTLVSDVSFLFLGETFQKTKEVFSANNSKSFPIRYINIDANAEGSLSVDYSLTDKQLIIATSKNAMWAILDKIVKEGQK